MGLGLVNEEYSKVEHSIVLMVMAAVTVHVFSRYAIVNVDTTAFIVFAAMCFAGYFALKTAQEIMSLLEERKQAAYETLKSDIYYAARGVAPVGFNQSRKYSKYATSAYKKLKAA